MMHAMLVETLPDFGWVQVGRMRCQQSSNVVGRLLAMAIFCVQHRHSPPNPLTFLEGLHDEVDDVRRCHRREGEHRGLVIEQQHLLEADIADLGPFAEDHSRGGQCHLAIGGPG